MLGILVKRSLYTIRVGEEEISNAKESLLSVC